MNLRKVGSELDGTGSRLCPVIGFGISGVAPVAFTIVVLLYCLLMIYCFCAILYSVLELQCVKCAFVLH